MYGFPFTKLAEQLGKVGTANVIALGAIIAVTGIVKPESLEASIKEDLKVSLQEINIKAMHLGMSLILKTR